MKLEGVEQAEAKLAKARRDCAALHAARGVDEAFDAWTNFVYDLSALYSKLQQGAKGDGKSTAWFGTKIRERKTDELLRYLHFARDSEQHGISKNYAVSGANYALEDGRRMEFNERKRIKANWAYEKVAGEGVKPHEEFDAMIVGPSIQPVRVLNRGVWCEPPRNHLGAPILEFAFVNELATLAIRYFEQMVVEARGLL